MAKTNVRNSKAASISKTHEGAQSRKMTPVEQLERSVMANLLWENSFYEDGKSNAERIAELIKEPSITDEEIYDIIVRAKQDMKLRHCPLYLTVLAVEQRKTFRSKFGKNVVEIIITRVDDMMELLSLYWRSGKKSLPHCFKKGLANCFYKFDEYQFAKYDRDGNIKLRDVLRLVHPVPRNTEESALFGRIKERALAIPNTWETRLSSGENKKKVFEDLMETNKLPALGFLRNIRLMDTNLVDPKKITKYCNSIKVNNLLPFQFITSARINPKFEKDIEKVMMKALNGFEKLSGKTLLVIDVSGSMEGRLSNKGETTRLDAACGLGILCREICDDIEIYTFSNNSVYVPKRNGFALKDAIVNSQSHGGTNLGSSLSQIYNKETDFDRLIVITDEQSTDLVKRNPVVPNSYIINVASYQNGINNSNYLFINGWSEHVLRYIVSYEKMMTN